MNTPHVILFATHPEVAGRGRACLFSLGGEALVQRLLRQCNEAGFYSIQVLYPVFADAIATAVASCLPSAFCTALHMPHNEGTNTPCSLEKRDLGNWNGFWHDSVEKQRGILFVDAGCAVSEQFFLMLRKHATGPSFQVTCLSGSEHHLADDTTPVSGIHGADASWHALCTLYLSPEDVSVFLPSPCTVATSLSFLAGMLQHDGFILPAKKMILAENEGSSCHSSGGYKAAQIFLENRDVCTEDTILLVDVAGLKQTEEHDPVRVEWLMNKIMEEQVWTQPLCVALDQGFVMDGHHRFAVARKLGLSKVPAIQFCYSDVAVWSLRPAVAPITKECFLASIAAGKIYPYKTVKHRFPKTIPSIAIPLSMLQ